MKNIIGLISKFVIFCFILHSSFNQLLAQQILNNKPSDRITFEHLNVDNGLSDNNVTCILQDRNGFLWFGTERGLNKYDGYHFTIYKHNKDNPNSLYQNYINTLYEDKSGIIWIGTRSQDSNQLIKGSLSKYNPEKDQFENFINNPTDSMSIPNSFVTSICEDDSGELWIGTMQGVCKFVRKNEQFKWFVLNPVSQFTSHVNRVTSIIETENKVGQLIIASLNGGLYIYDQKNNKLRNYCYKTSPFNKSTQDIRTICEDQTGMIWIGTDHGLSKFDLAKEQFKIYVNDPKNAQSLSSNRVKYIFMDNSGVLWIGTDNGLNKFDRENDRFIRYISNPQNEYTLIGSFINTIYEDISGIYWIGTFKGISKFYKQKENFIHYKHDPLNVNSVSDNRIWASIQDENGLLWIGTFNGLNKYNQRNETFKRFLKKPENKNKLSNNRIECICESDLGEYWIGTNGGGLLRYNIHKQKFIQYLHFNNDPYSLSNNFVKAIHKDKTGGIWVGTGSGLDKYDPEKDRFFHYQYNSKDLKSRHHNEVLLIEEFEYNGKNELWIATHFGGVGRFDLKNRKFVKYYVSPENNSVWIIYKDQFGEMWFATRGGLNRYDKINDRFIRYNFDEENLEYDITKSIVEDDSGNLWTGNYSGLYKFDRKNDSFKRYGKDCGIMLEKVDAIVVDDYGYLWISNNDIIVKYHPDLETVFNYKIQEGVQNQLRIIHPSFKCKNGNIFFSGINGFLLFNPSDIKQNSTIPTIAITDFKIFNKSVEVKNMADSSKEREILMDKSISYAKEILFPSDKNVFSIEFSSLDFTEPEKNKYAYQLEGVDPEWVYTDAENRFATYNHLDPGEYIFHVKGSNNDGVWNQEGTSLKVIITPLWWQTWWFRILTTVVILGTVALAIYTRIRNLEQRNQAQKEFARKLIESQEVERKRIASALHDSHGQNLLIINNGMQQFIREHSEFSDDLTPLSQTTQESIEEIREISYDLHPHLIDRLGLTKAIESVISKIKNHSDINFERSVDKIDNIFDKKVEINIYRIIQESVNNIIKHSKATNATIKISSEPDNVFIRIQDDGIGFNVSKVKKGLGLDGIEERAAFLGGNCKIKSNHNSGTDIQICIPTNKLVKV